MLRIILTLLAVPMMTWAYEDNQINYKIDLVAGSTGITCKLSPELKLAKTRDDENTVRVSGFQFSGARGQSAQGVSVIINSNAKMDFESLLKDNGYGAAARNKLTQVKEKCLQQIRNESDSSQQVLASKDSAELGAAAMQALDRANRQAPAVSYGTSGGGLLSLKSGTLTPKAYGSAGSKDSSR